MRPEEIKEQELSDEQLEQAAGGTQPLLTEPKLAGGPREDFIVK